MFWYRWLLSFSGFILHCSGFCWPCLFALFFLSIFPYFNKKSLFQLYGLVVPCLCWSSPTPDQWPPRYWILQTKEALHESFARNLVNFVLSSVFPSPFLFSALTIESDTSELGIEYLQAMDLVLSHCFNLSSQVHQTTERRWTSSSFSQPYLKLLWCECNTTPPIVRESWCEDIIVCSDSIFSVT